VKSLDWHTQNNKKFIFSFYFFFFFFLIGFFSLLFLFFTLKEKQKRKETTRNTLSTGALVQGLPMSTVFFFVFFLAESLHGVDTRKRSNKIQFDWLLPTEKEKTTKICKLQKKKETLVPFRDGTRWG
jgi:hypothetical protein